MHVPLAAGLILVAGLLACAGDSNAPAHELTSLRVEGRVLDPAGAPVESGRVVFLPWYDSGLKEAPGYWPTAWAVTDAEGRFELNVPALAGVAMDSIGLTAYAPGCSPEAVTTVMPADDLPEGPAGTITLDLAGPAVLARPVTAVGDVCSAGDDPTWGAGDIALGMRIDSVVGALVYGRWGVFYSHSSVGPDGTFEGVQGDGLLALSMVPGELSTSWCTEVRMVIPTGAGGAWGRASVLFDDGCVPEGVDLVFMHVAPRMFP